MWYETARKPAATRVRSQLAHAGRCIGRLRRCRNSGAGAFCAAQCGMRAFANWRGFGAKTELRIGGPGDMLASSKRRHRRAAARRKRPYLAQTMPAIRNTAWVHSSFGSERALKLHDEVGHRALRTRVHSSFGSERALKHQLDLRFQQLALFIRPSAQREH